MTVKQTQRVQYSADGRTLVGYDLADMQTFLQIGNAVTVADTTDSTCWVGLFESATGSLAPKTDGALTYNASTGTLSPTAIYLQKILIFGANANDIEILPEAAGRVLGGTTSIYYFTPGAITMVEPDTFDGDEAGCVNAGFSYNAGDCTGVAYEDNPEVATLLLPVGTTGHQVYWIANLSATDPARLRKEVGNDLIHTMLPSSSVMIQWTGVVWRVIFDSHSGMADKADLTSSTQIVSMHELRLYDEGDFAYVTLQVTSGVATFTPAQVHTFELGATGNPGELGLYDGTADAMASIDVVNGVLRVDSIPVGGKKVITCVIDGGGSVPTTGVKGYWRSPWSGTITKATMLADVSGSAVIDVWKDTYANYPPLDADSITASAPPTLSSAIKSEDSTLTGWTTTITAGDVLGFNLDSCSTITRLTLELEVAL